MVDVPGECRRLFPARCPDDLPSTSGHLTDICVPSWPSGVLGGFTTSLRTSEARALVQDGQVPIALTYLFTSVAVGLAAAWSGIRLARALTRQEHI